MGYQLGPVKPFVADVANTVGPMFGISTIYGWRAEAGDMQGHPAGLALDFPVGDDKAKGDKLAAYLGSNAAALHIKYLCWQQQLWQPGKGWSPMAFKTGTKPGYDPNHRRHVHASFNAAGSSDNLGSAPAAGGSSSGAGSSGGSSSTGGGGIIDGVADALNPFDELSVLFKVETWKRVAFVIGGAGMIVSGLALVVLAMADTAPGRAVLSAVPQTRAVGAALTMKEGAA